MLRSRCRDLSATMPTIPPGNMESLFSYLAYLSSHWGNYLVGEAIGRRSTLLINYILYISLNEFGCRLHEGLIQSNTQ